MHLYFPPKGIIYFNLFCVCPLHKQNPKTIIDVPADGLAPNGARPSGGPVWTTKLLVFAAKNFISYW